jgi:hypothetical protein
MNITKIPLYPSPWERLKCFLHNPNGEDIAEACGLTPDFAWNDFRNQLTHNTQLWDRSSKETIGHAIDYWHEHGNLLKRSNQYLLCYALRLHKLGFKDSKGVQSRLDAAMRLFTVGLGVHALSPRNLNEFILLCCIASGLEFGDYASILKTVPVEDQPNLPPFALAKQAAFVQGNGTSILDSYVHTIATSTNPKDSLTAFLEKNREKLSQIFSKNRSTYYSIICGCQDPSSVTTDDVKLRYHSLFGLSAYCLNQNFPLSSLGETTIAKLINLFPDTFVSEGVFETYCRGNRNAEIYAGVYFLAIVYDIGIESAVYLESEESFRGYLQEQMIAAGFPASVFELHPFEYLVLCAYQNFHKKYQNQIGELLRNDSSDLLTDLFLDSLREYLAEVARLV